MSITLDNEFDYKIKIAQINFILSFLTSF